jgi:chromosome partitioning protein
MYIERAYEVAAKHSELFDDEDPADAFVITDDFMSAGRISGHQFCDGKKTRPPTEAMQ